MAEDPPHSSACPNPHPRDLPSPLLVVLSRETATIPDMSPSLPSSLPPALPITSPVLLPCFPRPAQSHLYCFPWYPLTLLVVSDPHLCPCKPSAILNFLNIQSAISLAILPSLTNLCLTGDHGGPSSLTLSTLYCIVMCSGLAKAI